jgi:hypothetical protein
MPTKHIHHDLICAWAAGEQIQRYNPNGSIWMDMGYSPSWARDATYRIKPEREYPKTSLSDYELERLVLEARDSNRFPVGHVYIVREIANAAIKQYILDSERYGK